MRTPSITVLLTLSTFFSSNPVSTLPHPESNPYHPSSNTTPSPVQKRDWLPDGTVAGSNLIVQFLRQFRPVPTSAMAALLAKNEFSVFEEVMREGGATAIDTYAYHSCQDYIFFVSVTYPTPPWPGPSWPSPRPTGQKLTWLELIRLLSVFKVLEDHPFENEFRIWNGRNCVLVAYGSVTRGDPRSVPSGPCGAAVVLRNGSVV